MKAAYNETGSLLCHLMVKQRHQSRFGPFAVHPKMEHGIEASISQLVLFAQADLQPSGKAIAGVSAG
jgi:hypothetical protein